MKYKTNIWFDCFWANSSGGCEQKFGFVLTESFIHIFVCRAFRTSFLKLMRCKDEPQIMDANKGQVDKTLYIEVNTNFIYM